MQENEDNKFELRLRANYEHLRAHKFVIFCHQSAVEKRQSLKDTQIYFTCGLYEHEGRNVPASACEQVPEQNV